ncbi:8-amino-7-oxononanoate synthase [Bacteroides gallinaceum]|uniref:8-amino-7-oxononanoate synthase n=1 Tax=Bacteroides gallinaceum TaxID=1462571 RepID=UPI0025A457BF|nr:8-amino-7-oxononanoate synthase [Bacteroides gallinaceum]MDM8155063.1 8-amino-7-oxononanoate synthase [Bacteroides gallinaceum]
MKEGQTLCALAREGNLRTLPEVRHDGIWIEQDGRRMLNMSSNDYLGLASDATLQDEFWQSLPERDRLLSASSSRLLTGNFDVHQELETLLAERFGRESALTFSSGYHLNTGILPAVADVHTLILADKLVHASLIDGIRLSSATCIRYRHQDYRQLQSLLEKHRTNFERMIIVTESVFSMDGDVAPLAELVELKKAFPNVMLYVDEAHAIGVRGKRGLGIAEEQGCLADIDFLCGTFGKALASVGAYVVCSRLMHDYLVNRMRTLIFTTALPPLNVAWTKFVFSRLDGWEDLRIRLASMAEKVRGAVRQAGYPCPSESHIVPLVVGESEKTVLKAAEMQRKGFYVLPVRPPTVPAGTSRLRLSLTAALPEEEVERLGELIVNS